jgi:hypothetical protein
MNRTPFPIRASPDRFPVKVAIPLPSLPRLSQPSLQAPRQFFRFYPFEDPEKRALIRCPIRQFQKLPQFLFPLLPEGFHVLEIFPVTQQRRQSYDEDVFQFVPQIPPLPPGVGDPLQLFFASVLCPFSPPKDIASILS